jgi:hypothetical protein
MVLFKIYPQILTRLNEYKARFNLSLIQRFYCYWLVNFVTKFIRHRNQEINAIESEQMFTLEAMREEMTGIVKAEVEVREKKWRYLSRGLCRVEELEVQCDTALNHIERMTCIFEENKVKFKKSKEFNLLLLFYFLKISFLNNGRELRANLKEIYYGYKVDELRSLKEFRKFIFHKQSCAIETLIDNKSMGNITNVSNNVIDMFGVPALKIKGTCINDMMPQFMADEHEHILSEWAKTGTWRTIGKLKEIYCIHKEEHCFSALIYLKIYVRNGSLHFITNIFKINDCDYLVLSPQGQIQGMGRKFMRVLGEEAKNLSLSLMVETSSMSPNHEAYEDNRTYRRVFMGPKGMEERVHKYHQDSSHTTDVEEKENIDDDFHCHLKAHCPSKYFVEFTVKTYHMGRVAFQILQMRESRVI